MVRERDAQWRRCHFQREPLMEASEWINRYVAFWNGRLDALAQLLESPPPAKKPMRAAERKPAKRKTRKAKR